MSNISNIGDVYRWSIAKIAEAFAMDRKVVKKRLLEANIPVAGTVRGNPVYALRDVGPALFESKSVIDSDIHDPSRMEPKERKDWFQSENERIKMETTLKQLVPASDVHREMALMLKVVTQVLDTWPDKLERDRGWNVSQIAEAQRAVDDIREALSTEMRERDDEEE
ncbi:DUF1441 family protein [Escherichia coli]|nr:DUF1441 family protein [Escherichia coli]MBA8398895.1 DUF1441 family protein [Escherichia coli]MXF53949.1 DUF1441 family protein [Escherichia coli]MXF73152.1 DUF1441 family protein [Escherichia coli]MXH28199.1 DUF1441 family protein [Escherichia coli]